jgi:DNA-binding CsgD family transcriptional regulator
LLMADHQPDSASFNSLRGRESECATLDALLDRVRGGRSAVLVLRGEAGIGKTALLRYMTDRATGFTIARCTGVESEMELPFAGLHELSTPMLGSLDVLVEPQQRALSVALGLAAGQRPDPFLVAVAALSLLAEAAEQAPLLCAVDDAQWLDRASAQVLGFVGRRLLAEPIGLVFAARVPVTSPDHLAGLPELPLGGLDELSARALLASVADARIDEKVRARIIEETHGNPLALLELGAGPGAADFAGGFAVPNAANLPLRIENQYLARLRELSDEAQRLVVLAAAEPVGDTALLARAAHTLGLDIDAGNLAVDAGLLTIGAGVRFRHPLFRSAAYRSASIEDRRAAHAALAAATDPEVDPDRRAWHRAYAASAPDEAVAAELIGSADRAQRRGGVAAAAAFWERAVALTPDLGDRASRALAAGEAKFAAGDFQAAQKMLAIADIGPLDELRHAQVQRMHAQIAFALNRGRDAPPLLLQAAQRLQPLDADAARETLLEALVASVYAGRLAGGDGSVTVAKTALSAPFGPEPVPHQDRLLHGLALRITGGYVAAAPMLKEALHQYRSQPQQLDWLCVAYNMVAMELWDDSAWFELASNQAALARASGTLSWLPFALDYLAESHIQAGDLSRAEALMMERERVEPGMRADTLPYVALLLAAWRGDKRAAAPLIDALAAGAASRGEGVALTYAEYAKAVLYNGLGDYELAAEAAHSASTVDELVITPWALYEFIEAAVRSGRPQRAAAACEQLSATAAASGTDWAYGAAARSRALLAGDDIAEDSYSEAIDHLSRTRMATHLARARLCYGEWLRRQNRRVDARMQLRPAFDDFAAMGANGFGERARRELQATGEKVRKRRVDESTELTPQEEQIAQLARERRTNPEIGAHLFLSARTVEWHLRKIFAKLGISSRRELDAALTRRDRGANVLGPK